MAVIYSCLAVICLATVCLGGTIPNRPAFPVPTGQIQPQSGAKSSPRRVMNAAFANAGRHPGLEIWRIENFEPVVYPKNNYGKFYTGDSFLVLNTVERKDKQLSWDIHFWLGSETSTDEAGAAAVYAVQLDDLLNGAPVQHREVQDHESQLFLSYFKNSVRYEQGGVGSGFKHVETNAAGAKRLFQVKGKRNVRVRQVNLSVSSMNKGDCFILDAGKEIMIYVGPQAKRVEKLKAISAANQIRDQDHSGRSRVDIIDEFSSDLDKQKFFDVLGSGSPGQIPDESSDMEDGAFETADANSVTLYKVTDAAGGRNIDTIPSKPLRQEMLNTNDCFILDTGSGIYVWIGRLSTQKERSDAMAKAQELLRTKKYPAWTQVHRLVEGAESAPFKQYFATWRDVGMAHTRLVRSAVGYDSEDSGFVGITDADSLIDDLKKASDNSNNFVPENGENDISEVVQYIDQADTEATIRNVVQVEHHLTLLDSTTYVITYKYNVKNGESAYIIYVWHGAKTSQAVKERALRDAVALAEEHNAILVHTTQNHEPSHFLQMIKGKMATSYTAAIPTSPRLFRIRSTVGSHVHTTEVIADSSALASKDVFALITMKGHKIYIWIGLGSSEIEADMAKERFANYWPDADVHIIEEGAEPDDFWELLNGEGIYDCSLNDDKTFLEPRLFHCHLNENRLQTEEVSNFDQADLNPNDVMLLDAGEDIYMWVGSGTAAAENRRFLDMAKKYIKSTPTERTIDTVTIIRIPQGSEPRAFTDRFPSWRSDKWQTTPAYKNIGERIKEDSDQFYTNEI